MNLLQFRDEVEAARKAGLPAGTHVESHPGRLDETELRRIAARAPAAHVAVLGVLSAEKDNSGRVEVDASMAVFLATKAAPGTARDAAMLVLSTAALILIPDNLWGLEETQHPRDIRGQNLFTGTLEKQGVALWGITWRQQVTVDELDDSLLDDLKTVHADWDVGETAGTPEPEDLIKDLDQ